MAHINTLRVRDQKSDFLTIPTSSATAQSPSTSSYTPSSTLLSLSSDYTMTSTTPSPHSKTKEGGGLSPGAFVGIGLAVAVVFVGAVWAIMWTVRKRWRTNIRESNHGAGGAARRIRAAELGDSIPVWEVGRDGVRGNVFTVVGAGAKDGIYRGG